ncbi:hypothetical protein L6452_35046 [Arctium lappa]|uniref:Uncharacterized protein n=1 Tax=Arctium lappa TaxID=4217 RepID=A0ACB8YKY7_ARCLA|nr:hypothetical protein L6452_35046 [Arctium lappa]
MEPNFIRRFRTVTRAVIEGFASTMHVSEQVINGWADVLNYEERFRSRDSPKRYFFKTGILVDGVTYYYMHDVNKRFTRFQRNLGLAASCNTDATNMKNIDLAFFPLNRGSQYYCVVLNLKTLSVEILDSSAREGDVDDRYDYDITILQTMMV